MMAEPTFRELVAPAQARLVRQRCSHERRRFERRGYVTPPWDSPADRHAVDEFVAACPPEMSVEHICPRGHPEVMGLHTLANLQHLSPEENNAKSNRLPEGLTPADAVRLGLAIWRSDVRDDGSVNWEPYLKETAP